jgi:site-specific DNA-methyltransferase (adenine-specific)
MLDLRTGDCLDVLAELEACSVDALVTDPPYGLGKPPPIREVLACWLAGETYEAKGGGFMGKTWDAMVPPPKVWAAALRVVKPGAWGVVFAGTRTVDLMGISLRLGGWEVRDQIAYLYGSGFPKSLNGPWGGTALKPALEPALLVRRPLDGTYAENATRWGVGGLNIDAGRIGVEWMPRTKSDGTVKSQNRAMAVHNTGRVRLDDVQGRWPANVMLGHNEDCGEDCTTGCAVAMLDKQSGTEGGASRFFYTAKPSRSEREAGLDGLPVWTSHEVTNRDPDSAGAKHARSGKTAQGEVRNHHPTVKPVDLMRHLVQLVTPPAIEDRRPLVLDPFMGSGTTGMAAAGLGLDFLGIDLDPAHVQIARARIEWAAPGRRVDCDQQDTREQPQQGRLF